jgi:3-mercaptopyruvate sulfurtransferase SseA
MLSNKQLFFLSIFILALILIAGSVWWTLKLERASPDQASPAVSPTAVQLNPNSELPYPEILRVSKDTAKAAFDTGRAVFIDARSAASYSEGHIPGALLMNEEDIAGFVGDLDRSTWIITYCT